MAGALGILAGTGDLPVELAERAAAQGLSYCVLRLGGLTDPRLLDHPGAEVALGRVGQALDILSRAGCDRVLFSGKVMRPRFRDLKLDWRGAVSLAQVIGAWARDDDLHRAISRLFEKRGLVVVGPTEIWPDLLAPSGLLSRKTPDDLDWADIRAAAGAARAVGATDMGQGAVARGGRVLDVEDRTHTDGLLARVAHAPGSGGVLVKLAKAHQDRRVDLPVIGPATIAAAKAARLSGVAIQTGAAIIARRAETIRAADEAGLFLFGFDPGAP